MLNNQKAFQSLQPWQRNEVHQYIKNRRKYYPYFKLGNQAIIFHIQKEMSIIWLILAIQTQRVILCRTKRRDII
ncbi:unnamed protein product [Camellia sinensis]